ncbi:TPA: hypothetical protein I7748_21900 [Vibrio vulnificus]|nr:hypothetical protein [Vibrio vulnificus]
MAQSRFGSFAFALSFPKVVYQNFRVLKSHERLQSLNQFGFQSSGSFTVSQIRLISGLGNLRC